MPAEARSAKVGGRDRLDAAIDRAVREMLDVEPPSGLRGRVLDRIDLSSSSVASSTSSVASAFRRKVAWTAVSVAAAAVIVLALLSPWRQPAPPIVARASPSIAKVDLPPTVPVPPVTAPKSSESPKTVTIPASRGAGERIIVAVVLADDDASTIDPLAPITPISVAPARPADIAPKAIAISPLAPITELQIAPLFPPERRN